MSHFDISSWRSVHHNCQHKMKYSNLKPGCWDGGHLKPYFLYAVFLQIYFFMCTSHGIEGMFFWYQKELLYFGIKHDEYFLGHLNILHWRNVVTFHLLKRRHVFSWGMCWPDFCRQPILKRDCDLLSKQFTLTNSHFNFSFCGRHCWTTLLKDTDEGFYLWVPPIHTE